MKITNCASFGALALSLASADAASSSYNARTFSSVSPSASDIAKQASNATTNHRTSNVQGAAARALTIIWLENTDYQKAALDENLMWLAAQGITLDNYWALTHPSEPNYLASVGGDYFALDDDRFISMPANVSTVVDLLDTKNISWAEYQEHLPYSGFNGFNYSNQETFANDYVRKHNPLALYDSVNTNPDRSANIKNFTMFYNDLNSSSLPQYSIITPNMTNDAHDTTIKVAGQWARNFLEPLLSNEYFMNDSLVLLTFDENETYSVKNKVFTILLGGAIPEHLRGTSDSTYYDHYSQLSSVEANWNLPSLGRHDVDANVFQIIANATNITNQEVDTTYKINNATYVGYLLDTDIALPAPNVTAINKNGKGVLKDIVSVWSSEYSAQSSATYFTSTTTTQSSVSLTDLATLVTANANASSIQTSTASGSHGNSSTSASKGNSSTSVSHGGAGAVEITWTSLVALMIGSIFA
ncbi:LANO_0G18206g1_1 [Lachancea nothofagi CBS 11611]|uniref:acid phosphatase n=1 Tax=Lachancea nothofagi CBS 11611 TaxID=1266666 RepID=A0A1G4KKK4_9SACH|nr:LANO_0G18206g1_1 [Lachancea nothofagi CBS 11611]